MTVVRMGDVFIWFLSCRKFLWLDNFLVVSVPRPVGFSFRERLMALAG